MHHIHDPFDRFRIQLERIRRDFCDPGGGQAPTLVEDDPKRPSYVYDRDHLVAAEGTLDFVRGLLPHARALDEAPVHGSRRIHTGGHEARAALATLRRARPDAAVGLNHLITITDDVNLCPAAEPLYEAATAEPTPARAANETGRDIVVKVIDTGLVPTYQDHPWIADLQPSRRFLLADGEAIPLDYGHGTFVAGVLRRVAPEANVIVNNDFRCAGALTECMLRDALMRAITEPPTPHIISLSAGGSSEDGITMHGLAGVVEEIRRRGIVLVAAAGNNGDRRRFFPAAFPGVVSVGAVREDHAGQACFSNYGSWISIYAPGERLINAFAKGDYVVYHHQSDKCLFRDSNDPRFYRGCTCVTTLPLGQRITFTGMARWSGTSFATPVVAGLIAIRMSAADSTARQAADWLLRHAHHTIPGLGPVVLPGQKVICRGTDPDCGGDC